MKKDFKKEIRRLPIPVLQNRIQEMETERMRLEMELRKGTKRTTYPSNKKGTFGNMKKIRHIIAFLKNTLHLKTIKSAKEG